MSTLAATGLTAGATAYAKGGDASLGRQIYELRVYHLKAGVRRELLDKYLEKALIPALNQAGIAPVGVFSEIDAKAPPALQVLIPYPTADAFLTISAELNSDPKVRSDGADYLSVTKEAAVFERIDSWLLLAFAGLPHINLPEFSVKKQKRIFEIRTYESHSEAKALKKVEMFNSGEIELMKSLGMGPVFFGQALTGSGLPHLTYMLSATDADVHKKYWDAFRKHPTWEKMKNDPQYADTVSKVISTLLEPTEYSQI